MILPEVFAPYRDKVVLITGGAGFVGTQLVAKLLLNERNPTTIWIVDNLLSSERATVPSFPQVRFIEGSIADDSILRELPPLDYVFHLATYHGNQSSIQNPLDDLENNTRATIKLFEMLKARAPKIPKVVYASAGCAVAEKTVGEAVATTEDAPVYLWHDSPYQISKIVGEMYANFYFMQHGLPVVKARFQNVYGPGEILGAGRWRGTPATVWRNVVPTFIYRALKGQPLEVQKDASRDFIYVDDIVRGLLLCGVRGVPGEVYNLASGVETSIGTLAKMINSMVESPAPTKLVDGRGWDRSWRRFGEPAKAKEALGFTSEVDLYDGLERTIRWTEVNMDLIDRCVKKHMESSDWWRDAVL